MKIGLTPVMEEFTQLRLTSTVKKSRDDYCLTPSRVPLLDFDLPEWQGVESVLDPEQPPDLTESATPQINHLTRVAR
jgi:DDE superfamily endonuclease